jgi:hypothetical protein
MVRLKNERKEVILALFLGMLLTIENLILFIGFE